MKLFTDILTLTLIVFVLGVLIVDEFLAHGKSRLRRAHETMQNVLNNWYEC